MSEEERRAIRDAQRGAEELSRSLRYADEYLAAGGNAEWARVKLADLAKLSRDHADEMARRWL